MLPWHWRTSKRGYPEQICPHRQRELLLRALGRSSLSLALRVLCLIQVAIPAEWPQTRDIGPVTESWGDSFGGHYILQLRSPVTNSSTSDGGTVRPPPRLRREP
eukprot:scaffold72502_cov31-Tisochrysis_lutea.AAC.7